MKTKWRKIVCCGMYRAGSTWQYNIVRLACPECEVGYANIDQRESSCYTPNWAYKCHEFSESLAKNATLILTSHRDPRDALMSMKRKFNMPPSITAVDEFMGKYLPWSRMADYDMRFEDMMSNKEQEAERILKIVGSDASVKDILKQVEDIQPNQNEKAHDPISLLHKDHITNTKRGDYINAFHVSLLFQIEEKYGAWMEENGYKRLLAWS